MNQLITILLAMLIGAMLAPYVASAIDRQDAAEREFIQQHIDRNNGYFDEAKR